MRPSILAGVLTVFLVVACVTPPPGQQHFLDSQKLIREGKIEEGLQSLQQAAEADPKNFRSTYFRERELRMTRVFWQYAFKETTLRTPDGAEFV